MLVKLYSINQGNVTPFGFFTFAVLKFRLKYLPEANYHSSPLEIFCFGKGGILQADIWFHYNLPAISPQAGYSRCTKTLVYCLYCIRNLHKANRQ